MRVRHSADGSSLTSITIPVSVTEIVIYAFKDCGRSMRVTYSGTKAQWQAISKYGWFAGNYTVTCTDGTIKK